MAPPDQSPASLLHCVCILHCVPWVWGVPIKENIISFLNQVLKLSPRQKHT